MRWTVPHHQRGIIDSEYPVGITGLKQFQVSLPGLKYWKPLQGGRAQSGTVLMSNTITAADSAMTCWNAKSFNPRELQHIYIPPSQHGCNDAPL